MRSGKRLCWVLNGMGACGLVVAVATTLVLAQQTRGGDVSIEDGIAPAAPRVVWLVAGASSGGGAAARTVGMVVCGSVGVAGVVRNFWGMRSRG